MSSTVKPSLLAQTKQDLETIIDELGERPYRVKQILDWIYTKRVDKIENMSDVPAKLREKLAEEYTLHTLEHVSVNGAKDTTQKFLLKLDDGRYVETVLIPANIGDGGIQAERRTLCVSSQVGCAYGCKFCASGLAGFTRNLRPEEIIGQILTVEKISGEKINNIVFMGMGEPMANYKNLDKALDIITGQWGVNIGARRINVSTSGLAPQIKLLADRGQQIRLAISLHGATDEVRERIMPVNKKYPLKELIDALRYWKTHSKQKFTFEFILIKGVNDSFDQARQLAKLAKSLHAKVNLIPYNTVEGLEWERPALQHCKDFAAIVHKAGVTTTLRNEKGHDIAAACGQLRLKQETAEGIIEAPVKTRK